MKIRLVQELTPDIRLQVRAHAHTHTHTQSMVLLLAFTYTYIHTKKGMQFSQQDEDR
jgi:hypothetical protein